jgi:hypothetical protein
VRVLHERPGVEHECAQIVEVERTVRPDGVPRRVLHEGIGRDDEVTGQPAADPQRDGGQEVPALAEPPLAAHQHGEKAGLEEEREDALHRQRLADDSAGLRCEPRPVGAELELHRDAGHDSHRERQAEDPDPDARRVVPRRPAGSERHRLENDDEERQPHGELGEEVVEGERETELESMPEQGIGHRAVSLEDITAAARAPLSRGSDGERKPRRAVAPPGLAGVKPDLSYFRLAR